MWETNAIAKHSCSHTCLVARVVSREGKQWSSGSAMEVEASYSYGFLPSGRHQPYAPPPPHPAEEGELWEYFPCPFCYIEVEVPFICNHLQEEHCFDTRNAVCPLCADNIGRDMGAHFRVQHSHLLKRRKPSRPSSSWPTPSNNSDPYFEGPPQYMMNNRTYQDPAPDPLLSQFICSMAQTDTNSDNTNTEIAVSAVSHDQRLSQRVTLTDDASKLELKERLQRIEFVKEIIMSTIL
uniref:Drought induced 19 protein type zinc-binding domain-containing protein n=2 Tax=Oryza TaxID=4527 RepID=A0A0D3EZ69_9ORYZ